MGVLEDIQEQYPSLAWLINDPEVGPLLRDAVDPNKGFSPSTFQTKLYQTNWFKSRSTRAREMEILRNTDPGEYQRRWSEVSNNVRLMASRLGIRLSDNEIKYMTNAGLTTGASVDSAEGIYSLMQFLKGQGGSKFTGGSIKGAMNTVNNMARGQYYMRLGTKELQNLGIEMALGVKDEAAIRQMLAQKAVERYPHLKDQILAGQSMEDIFSGHRQLLAEELELEPGSVDFMGKYNKVLQTLDKSTNKFRPMTLNETMTMARREDRWWQTARGKEQDAGMANFILKMFGKRA